MRRMITVLALLGLVAVCVRPASAAGISTLSGTLVPVNTGPGDQYDPHVSGDRVSYTDFSVAPAQVRYHNLVTGADAAIPSNGATDVVSNISGTNVVYMHIVNGVEAIYLYDISTNAAPVELDPTPGEIRAVPSIGGRTVAWEDSTSNPNSSDIVVYNLDSGTATQITNDAPADLNPNVSPDGSVIVWTKCSGPGTGCRIWQATQSNGSWATQPLTSGTGEEELPHTNGQIVVYDSVRTVNGVSNQEVYWQPVGGGAEHQITGAPFQARNAHVSGNLISFEMRDPTAADSSWNIYVYSLATGAIYQVTTTPSLDKVLNDISVSPDGTGRLVWAVNEPGSGYNVYGFLFQTPVATEQLTVNTSGLGGNRTTISNGGSVLGTASDASPLIVSLAANTALSLRASPLVAGPDGTQYFFQGFTSAPPASLTDPFTATAAYLTMAQIVGNGLASGGIYGPGANGIASSLTQQWATVQADIQAGNITQALADLQSFVCHVQAQTGKQITPALANQLVSAAVLVYTSLGGGSLPPC